MHLAVEVFRERPNKKREKVEWQKLTMPIVMTVPARFCGTILLNDVLCVPDHGAA